MCDIRWLTLDVPLTIYSCWHNLYLHSWHPFRRAAVVKYFTQSSLKNEHGRDHTIIATPLHALTLNSCHFLIIYGDLGEQQHRVCLIDKNPKKPFVDKKGRTDNQLGVQRYLALDGDENILELDRYNRRVLLLSPSLEFKRELLSSKKQKGLYNSCLVANIRFLEGCLDSKQCRLLVADNDNKCGNGKSIDGQTSTKWDDWFRP